MLAGNDDASSVAPGKGSHRALATVHHTRKGLSVPLALRGVEGVALDTTDNRHAIDTALAETLKFKGRAAGLQDVRAELTIELSGLARMEKTGAALRVFAVLFTWLPSDEGPGHEGWVEYGRTETVQHGSSPQFTNSFILGLFSDTVDDAPPSTRCRIQAHSRISASLNLNEQVLLGAHEFSLSELYHVPGRTEKKKLPDDGGSLTVRMSPIESEDYSVSVAVSASEFRCNEAFHTEKASLPDLFFIMLRGGKGDVANVEACYRSETVWQSESPAWHPFEMSLHRLCTGELDHMLVFQVWDWNSSGEHQLLGQLHMTARQLVNQKTGSGATIMPPEAAAPNLPKGILHITGDMRTQVKVAPSSTDTGGYTLYYADVGDDAKQEDNRFLAGLLSDVELKRSGMRQVVDEGLQAVAERNFYMGQFLANRAAVQGNLSKSKRTSGTFGVAFDPTTLLSPMKVPQTSQLVADLFGEPTKAESEAINLQRRLEASSTRMAGGQIAVRPSTPSMLKQNRPSRMRHSFGGVSISQSHDSLLNYSGSSSVQHQPRLSAKYKQLPAHIRGMAPPSRDTEGKLFNILFPRKRFGEMHGMRDDLSDLLRL